MKSGFSVLILFALLFSSCNKAETLRIYAIYPTNISPTTITCGGYIKNEQHTEIKSCGIHYTLDQNSGENVFVACDSVVQQGAYKCVLSNLIPDTLYYLTAYFETADDIYYALQSQFEIRTEYTLGHTGPAGGILIQLSPDKLHGMEISPEDLPAAAWGCKGTSIPAAENLPTGFGDDNTLAIIAACDTINAASTCANYSLNGYDDWYLPSAYELHYAFQNYFIKEDMWPFYSYFSSSQYDANNAWLVSLHDGKFTYTSKSSVYPKIRAIRYF